MPRVRTSAQLVAKLIARSVMAGENDLSFEGMTLRRHGSCEEPVVVWLNGRAIVDHPRAQYRWNRNADVLAPCRKCKACLRARAKRWAERAAAEISHAGRTWFVTLTLTPAKQVHALALARKAYRGCDEVNEGHLFRRRVTVINAEITKWLKRVRKNSKARLRVLLVAEAHKSGEPHFHALIHECAGSDPVLHRHITDAWTWGFSSAKLTPPGDSKAAWYVSKYLAKSALVRIRASARYGTGGRKPEVSKGMEGNRNNQQADKPDSMPVLQRGKLTHEMGIGEDTQSNERKDDDQSTSFTDRVSAVRELQRICGELFQVSDRPIDSG